jgi:hypothetical protein
MLTKTNFKLEITRTTSHSDVQSYLLSLDWWRHSAGFLMGSITYFSHLHPESLGPTISPFLIAVSWLYTVVRPVLKPTATLPYDPLAVYCAFLVTGVLMLGEVLFNYGIIGNPPPLLVTLALSANLGAVLGLLAFLGSIPLALPSNRVL